MRKRAQFRSKPVIEEPKHITQKPKPKVEKRFSFKNRKWWVAICLVSIFLLVLFFNTYYNLTSEISYNSEADGLEKFYLSGPDPYYNMRLIEGTQETGRYPYYSDFDPLLNYPLTARGGRAPLFNMMAIGFSKLLTPFMDEVDALGYSMQFIPALFGAILIFVVYFLGKELFNYKAGLIAAMFVAFIPIHLGSGHGSAFALFDHDSFNLLLFMLTFLFLVKSIKEENAMRSTLYAVLAGIPLAGLTMTWVEAQFLFTLIALYAIVQMFIDIYTSKIEFKVFRNASIILWTGWLVSMPVIASQPGGFSPNLPMFLCIGVTAFGFLYYLFDYKKIPWTISLPSIFTVSAIALVFLYFVDDIAKYISAVGPLERLAVIVFGEGIYGNKVSMTIAEANTYTISHTVMSFGPALYWIGWAGFLLLFYYYFKTKLRKDYLFIISIFIINIWLAGTAGRFLNDMVPLIAILAGWMICIFVDWLDYKQMIRNIKSAGGGIHGIRRGVKFLHIFGILFIFFIVLLPNTFTAFDAAVPNSIYQQEDGNWTTLKIEMFGDTHRGAFGLGIGKEEYWAAAFDWLNQQDTDIEDPANRPAFISWWDYGFYAVALGGHPTVADNFQDGIPPAANFHTASSEQDAVVVWIVRLLEGVQHHNGGKITPEVIEVLDEHLGKNNSAKIVQWIELPSTSPSYNEPITPEYDEALSKDYRIGQQYDRNAVYHDVIELLTNETTGLSDEEITWLYHYLQEVTGWSIRYYGVEGYDKQIFNIFAFLSDKSLLLVGGPEDDYIEVYYEGYTVDNTGERNSDTLTWSAKELKEMDDSDKKFIRVTGTKQEYKDPYFETMFYKTYIGPPNVDQNTGEKSENDFQVPCIDMKHFYAEYMSDLSKYPYYNTRKSAVVIAKYYEGAIVNGTVKFNNESLPSAPTLTVQKNLTYFEETSYPIEHDKTTANEDGNFSVLVGADAVIQISKQYPAEAQVPPFVYTNITFEGENGTEYAPITDDVAMRKTDDYERYLNISIEPANMQGVVYQDIDDDGVYNVSEDSIIPGVNLSYYPLDRFGGGFTTSDENGLYNFTNFIPDYYLVRAELNGFIIRDVVTTFYSGIKSLDISKSKLSSLEGRVNYSGPSGDIDIADAKVDLTYVRKDIQQNPEEYIFINTVYTDSDGKFKFDEALNPGDYLLNITSSETPNPIYSSQYEIQIQENETKIFNTTIDLTTVEVSGYTKWNDQGREGIDLIIEPDLSVEDNTAEALEEDTEITSNDEGYYEVSLSPGTYNVTVEHLEGTTEVYTYEGKFNLSEGQGSSDENILMTKHSVTVSGVTSYQGIDKNVSLIFSKDESTTGVSNTAQDYASAKSDNNGSYRVELKPGYYNVTVSSDEFNESGNKFTYDWSGKLTIKQADISTGKEFNIDDLKKTPVDLE